MPLRRRFVGLSLLDGIVLLATMALLAAVLFPVFAKARPSLPSGGVYGTDRKPIPGAVLRFRDGSGRVVETITADAHGYFRHRDLRRLSRLPIDGYAFTRYLHQTGMGGAYFFGPIVPQTARFLRPDGTPADGLRVRVAINQRTYQPHNQSLYYRELTADSAGSFPLGPDIPGNARFEFTSEDRRYRVVATTVNASPNAVTYDVRLADAVSLSGRVVGADGSPRHAFSVFATDDPTGHDIGLPPYRMAYTGLEGRFRIDNLLPGMYYIVARPLPTLDSIAPPRRVVVGQKGLTGVEIRAVANP